MTVLRLEEVAVASGLSGFAAMHGVQFYDGEFPAAAIARSLSVGLLEGEAAAVIATPEHSEAIRAALSPSIDRRAVTECGQLVFHDARALLAELFADGPPSGVVFDAHVRAPLGELARRFGKVHAYGEMVNLLAQDGDSEWALLLEERWDELLADVPIRLLCGYDLAAFDGDRESTAFRRVCRAHGHIHAVEQTHDDQAGRDRLLAELQQKTRLVRAAAERMERLQRITAALSEAVSSTAIAQVVLGQVAAAVGADRAILAVAIDDGLRLRLFCADPAAADGVSELGVVRADAPTPIAQAFRSESPSWFATPEEIGARFAGPDVGSIHALTCLPIHLAGQRLGASSFEYTRARSFSASDRELDEDLARLIAVALDRARVYEEASQARERAEQANRAKDEFLAMLGHELRNPLSPILTALQLMRLRGGDVLVRERTVIERQVQHMVRLVDDLLDVSRIARGKVVLKRQPIELAEAVAMAIEQAGPAFEDHAHKLDATVRSTGLLVVADGDRLAQAVANLLTNAAKYTPAGGSIRVWAEPVGARVRLGVRDTGIGIEPELLPRVFEQFVQSRRGLDRSEGGLGLGLAIVRALIESHGGTVTAHSDGLGLGSEFVIELPLVTVEPMPALDPTPTPTGGASWSSLSPPLSSLSSSSSSPGAAAPLDCPRRILVVDDNRDAAALLAEALELMGHEVRVEFDGAAALEVSRAFHPEIALLDIGLPAMDGYELAGHLHAALAELPKLVAITGYGQESDRNRTFAAGFLAHVVKPVNLDDLALLIHQLFNAPR